MYRPPAFREDRPDVLHQAIRKHPLGALISAGPAGLMANMIPFSLAEIDGRTMLRGHLAKGNDQIAELRQGAPVLVIFQGPQGYVSPSWYPSKREDGKVVPTWNYITVQARGAPRLIDDPEWLLAQIGDLTQGHEAGRAEPWDVADAPDTYVQALLTGIVGVEIPVERLEGKWKLSQNQPSPTKRGVVEGLRADGQHALADEIVNHANFGRP